MKVIAIPTVGNRPYLDRVLDSIQSTVGEYGWELALCPDVSPPLGCRTNTYRACEKVVKNYAEWILYLEDDVIVSRDCLNLCDDFAAANLDGILCLRRWHDTQDQTKPDVVSPADHGLLGDGFLFHRSIWPFLSKWWFRDEPGMGGRMWDWSVSWALSKNGIKQWRPLINRSQNIGVVGTHSTGVIDPNHHSPCWTGEPVTKFTFTP